MSIRTIPDIMYSWAEKRPDKVITRISPSMVGGCHRAHFLAIHGVKKTTPPNPGAILNFQVGFLWEKIVSEALKASDTPFLEQYHMVDETMNVEGTLDFAPYDSQTSSWEIWDSKTESILASKYRGSQTFFGSHPEYEHQLNTYQMLLTRQGFKVKRGRFGIIVKDNGFISEDETTFPIDSLQATKQRIAKLNGYLTRNELPPCECEGWRVGYCNYGDPKTLVKNSKGKEVNSTCCAEELYDHD